MKLLQRTHLSPMRNDNGGGWRFLLPVLIWWRRSYDIHRDEVRECWWWFSVSLGIERLGGLSRAHGIALRLTWGWIASGR